VEQNLKAKVSKGNNKNVMKALKLFFIFLIAALLPLYSCGKNSNQFSERNPEPTTIDSKLSTADLQQDVMNKVVGGETEARFKNISELPDVTNRMIIKSGTMSLETEKYDDAANQINDYVKKAGGFVTNSSSSVNASGKKQGSLTIRINSDKYDAMLKDMNNFGKVLNSQINGNDVTAEYIDLQARMNTQTELEKRLLALLNEKTAKLIDVVEVEGKLSNVREIIEKTQGRMKYLKNQTDFSTLTVSIYEPSLLNTSSGGGFFYEIGKGFSNGLKGFTEILSGMITVLISIIPVAITICGLAYITILIFRKIRSRKIKTA